MYKLNYLESGCFLSPIFMREVIRAVLQQYVFPCNANFCSKNEAKLISKTRFRQEEKRGSRREEFFHYK